MSEENDHPEEMTNAEETPEIYTVSFENPKKRFSRRKFIKAAAVTAAAATLASCGPIKLALSPTQTPEPTEAPSSTSKPSSTATKTRTPTQTYTSTPQFIPVKTRNQTTNLRAGPGTNFPVIGGLSSGTEVHVIGRLADHSWVQVRVNISALPGIANRSLKDVDGWIRSDLLDLKDKPISDLPVVVPPATATPLPNKPIPAGGEGIQYDFTDLYGNVQHFTLPCGATIPEGAICTCNCVTTCSCVGYVAPPVCSCDAQGGSTICTCDLVTYWYPD